MSILRGSKQFAASVCVVVLLSVIWSCSDHGTEPRSDPTNAIHDPWPDEEAELIALSLSGELSAPRDLYERVHADLEFIRDTWGDSISALRSIRFWEFPDPSRLYLSPDTALGNAIADGTPTDLDSLNRVFRLGGVEVGQDRSYAQLFFIPRLHTEHLVRAYHGLPGVRWVERAYGSGDGSTICPSLLEDGPAYLFYQGWGDCPARCSKRRFYYFRPSGDTVAYVGMWFPDSTYPRQPEPDWWPETEHAFESKFSFSEDEAKVIGDSIPPAAVQDLIAEPVSATAIRLRWTAPGDDGDVGVSYGHPIRYSSEPITEAIWEQQRVVTGLILANRAGTPEQHLVEGLELGRKYYFALKSFDDRFNYSAISNSPFARTLE